MTILLLILIGLLVGTFLTGGTRAVLAERQTKNTYGLPQKELKDMSWAGKQILKEYKEIPESNRPYANVKAIVTALDLKYGVEKVNDHFTEEYYDRGSRRTQYRPSWDHMGCYRYCDFDEYADLHKSFSELNEELTKQQHALALAGVAEGFTEAGTLMERLREEKLLINQVTNELTNG